MVMISLKTAAMTYDDKDIAEASWLDKQNNKHFLLLSNSDLVILWNLSVAEILFHIRHPFEMEY